MELSWINKTRVSLVMGLGILMIGIWAWPMVNPGDPYALVRSSNLSLLQMVTLIGLAVLTGALAYFIAWPYGREMAVLAVPAGLTIWAMRSGHIADMTQAAPDVKSRIDLYHSLMLEPFFWVVVVLAGLLGVRWAARIKPCPVFQFEKLHPTKTSTSPPVIIGAIAASLAIAHLAISAFAQGTEVSTGRVPTQPANGQIFFAVFMAFGLAAFVIRTWFELDFFWPFLCTSLLYLVGILVYDRTSGMTQVAEAFPRVCFVTPLLAILPIQIVSLGAMGAVTGYWASIRFQYWRAHEIHA